MKTKEIKESIQRLYNLHRNTKIKLLGDDMFSITLGDTLIELPYPKDIIRNRKIEQILNEKN